MFNLFKKKVKIDNNEITLKEFADMRRNIYLGNCGYDRYEVIKYIYQCLRNKLIEDSDKQEESIKKYFIRSEEEFDYRVEINIDSISNKFITLTYEEILRFIEEETTFENKVKELIINHIGVYVLDTLTDSIQFEMFFDKADGKLIAILTLKFIYKNKL